MYVCEFLGTKYGILKRWPVGPLQQSLSPPCVKPLVTPLGTTTSVKMRLRKNFVIRDNTLQRFWDTLFQSFVSKQAYARECIMASYSMFYSIRMPNEQTLGPRTRLRTMHVAHKNSKVGRRRCTRKLSRLFLIFLLPVLSLLLFCVSRATKPLNRHIWLLC